MKVIALDYGRAHTGVAVSDKTGTIVRPLDDINNASEEDGRGTVAEIVRSENAAAVIVGMPVSLSGEIGEQARETAEFIRLLKKKLSVPLIAWDERFTSKMASQRGHDSTSSRHGMAACVLLEDFLGTEEYRRLAGISSE